MGSGSANKSSLLGMDLPDSGFSHFSHFSISVFQYFSLLQIDVQKRYIYIIINCIVIRQLLVYYLCLDFIYKDAPSKKSNFGQEISKRTTEILKY